MKYKALFLFIAFGCMGMTVEIFFFAIGDVFKYTDDFSLSGKTYLWMFPIYGFTAFAFPVGYKLVKTFPLLIRLIVYTLAIFIVEYFSGWLIEALTGKCPWHYTTGWNISGYIRLDYTPFWMIFAYGMEKSYLFLDSLVVQKKDE